MSSNPVAETVASLMPRAKAELTELVASKSVADFAQFPRSESEGARTGWPRLRTEGFRDVALLDTPDGTQSVHGFLPGPEGAKTVLLYAHHDVQPPLDETAWVPPPFALTERDGRWYGQGVPPTARAASSCTSSRSARSRRTAAYRPEELERLSVAEALFLRNYAAS